MSSGGGARSGVEWSGVEWSGGVFPGVMQRRYTVPGIHSGHVRTLHHYLRKCWSGEGDSFTENSLFQVDAQLSLPIESS